jgi:hypothetical protein
MNTNNFDKKIKSIFENAIATRDHTIELFKDTRSGRKLSKKKAQEIFSNTILAESVFNVQLYEAAETSDIQFEISEPENPNIELLEFFAESLRTTYRAFTLEQYTVEEMKAFRVFVVSVGGEIKEAGFALKPYNGGAHSEVVAVHKNPLSGNIGKVADVFMKESKREGGKFLDHFDGPLSNIYDLNGFSVYKIYEWDDQYMPDGWNKSEEAINIREQKTIYSPFVGIEDADIKIDYYSFKGFSFERKFAQYRTGAVDVVARKI